MSSWGQGDRALVRARFVLGRSRHASVLVGGPERWLAGQAAQLNLQAMLKDKPGLADLGLVLVRRGL
jgi:hypothetical protein